MSDNSITGILNTLSMSGFRAGFKLNKKDIEYIQKTKLPKIASHAKDFITKRLSSKDPANDGRQTPFKGHPVFKAQHATATCCRGCLQKWHKIPKQRPLTKHEEDFIAGIIMEWIRRQYKSVY